MEELTSAQKAIVEISDRIASEAKEDSEEDSGREEAINTSDKEMDNMLGGYSDNNFEEVPQELFLQITGKYAREVETA